MNNTVMHESGKLLANKIFLREMHGQLLSLENARNCAALISANASLDALKGENRRLEAENFRLLKERDALEHAVAELRAEGSCAWERAEALDSVLEATAASLRPYGLDRKKFRERIAAIAERTPNSGPEASRHDVLLTAARKIRGL